jgi:hypothetical protein
MHKLLEENVLRISLTLGKILPFPYLWPACDNFGRPMCWEQFQQSVLGCAVKNHRSISLLQTFHEKYIELTEERF